MVTPGVNMADIGTDHSYLPAYLVDEEIIPHAIAMDIGDGPLSQAKETITALGLNDKIDLRLSDGLDALVPGEVQTVVIAGMGGQTIMQIMERGAEKLKYIQELILSPQSEITAVRAYLREHQWQIWNEDLICEDEKYYVVMKAYRNAFIMSSKVEDYIGPVLLKRRHPLLGQWMEREKKIQLEIMESLNDAADSPENEKRIREVENKLQMLEVAITWYNRGQPGNTISI